MLDSDVIIWQLPIINFFFQRFVLSFPLFTERCALFSNTTLPLTLLSIPLPTHSFHYFIKLHTIRLQPGKWLMKRRSNG